MLRKENFAPDEFYHIYNRTLFNIPVFKNRKNCERLMQALLLANSTHSSQAFQFLRNNENATIEDALEIAKNGEKFVDVICYTIMPNHYHLLLKERQENGITGFVHKCNISVAKYINTKMERRGPLFESLFKSKHISSNKYLLHLSLYIHLNPLDIISGKEWREGKLQNWTMAKKKLLAYPWSSLKSFLENKKDDLIISGTEIITDQFDGKKDYELFLQRWSEESLETIKDIAID